MIQPMRRPSASPRAGRRLCRAARPQRFSARAHVALRNYCLALDKIGRTSRPYWRTPRRGPFSTHGDNCRSIRGKRVARKRSRGARSKTHSCATTTPSVRRAIRASEETNIVLAKRHGVNRKTIAKWKAREFISDERMGPKNPRSNALTEDEDKALAMFELYPGGRIHDNGIVVAADSYFGFNGVCNSPNPGRSLSDLGYFAQMPKPIRQRYRSAALRRRFGLLT